MSNNGTLTLDQAISTVLRGMETYSLDGLHKTTVICDTTNNSDVDIAHGRLNVTIMSDDPLMIEAFAHAQRSTMELQRGPDSTAISDE